MGIGEDDLLNCSVTVMPVLGGKVGFLRRDPDDSFAGLLIAPGGSVETPDGEDVEGVRYYSAEAAAVRELREKCRLHVPIGKLRYFCSMSLPTQRMTLSFYCLVNYTLVARSLGYLEFYNHSEIRGRGDFAPGMKWEALKLLELLGLIK